MKNPQANLHVAPALVADADGRLSGLHDASGFPDEAACLRGALPTGAPACPARDVGERIGPFRPVGAPERLAARHAAFLDHVRGWNFSDEAGWDGAGPLAVDAPVCRVQYRAAAPGASHRVIGPTPFFFQRGGPAFIHDRTSTC